MEYRQKWDENVKSLQVLEEENASGSQVIRWETKSASLFLKHQTHLKISIYDGTTTLHLRFTKIH